MNFSYEFEGQPTDFQADSFCDDTEGGWEAFDYGEQHKFCLVVFEECFETGVSVLTKNAFQGKVMEGRIMGIQERRNGQILFPCLILLCLFHMGSLDVPKTSNVRTLDAFGLKTTGIGYMVRRFKHQTYVTVSQTQVLL